MLTQDLTMPNVTSDDLRGLVEEIEMYCANHHFLVYRGGPAETCVEQGMKKRGLWADPARVGVAAISGICSSTLSRGQAVMYTVPPNIAHVEEYRKAQAEAREAGRS